MATRTDEHRCKDCDQLLRYVDRIGWCHIENGAWILCPKKGEPQPA
jgi:hypothetical protein